MILQYNRTKILLDFFLFCEKLSSVIAEICEI